MLISFFLVAALLIEGLTGIVKTTLTGFGLKLQAWADQAISIAMALVIAVAGKIDFFAVVSELTGQRFDFPVALGVVLSGLVLARGSNAVHDLFRLLTPKTDNMRIW
ncbi:MAG: hypothetical protein ACM3WU_02440 [Bacillota bacterium]